MKFHHLHKPLTLLISLTLLAVTVVSVNAAAPATGAYDEFAASLRDGQAGVARGVYVPDVLALRVEQQPADDPTSVSPAPDVATQFQSAAAFGVTGLLAHNTSSGALFFSLASGQAVRIVYGDGATTPYRVTRIYRFQAVEPDNASSDLIDLSTGATLSPSAVFDLVYTGEDHVTFQTCIAQDGLSNWGRLFVIATPIN